MRLSRLFFHSLKEPPQDAESVSHQLLERACYLRKIGKGLFIYTPLLWRVLQKIMQILREELHRAGAQELLCPQLHPRSFWEQSGRWADFTANNLLYTLQDREAHPYCLGPTHEEIVTSLVAQNISSYKQLPLNLYQISSKFRDEIRPRFGLLRAKEFLMKDGYSFSPSPEGMEEQYQAMRTAYSTAFQRLALDFIIVHADGGKIGKGKSEEFQVVAATGEDVVLTCGGVAFNVETARAIPPAHVYEAEERPLQALKTPGVSTIEQLVRFTGLAPQQMVKTLIYKLLYTDRVEFIAVAIRGDRTLNEVKVANRFSPLDMVLASSEEIEQQTGAPVGFAGPVGMRLPLYADESCRPMRNFLSGANQKELHYLQTCWGRDCPEPEFCDFLLAEEGDLSAEHPGERYVMQRGIEVGHIFNLGTRYSEAFEATFQDEQGKRQPIWMGTYGIGVGRLAAACVEQHHDAKGIIWPMAIAPFRFFLAVANQRESRLVDVAEELYQLLEVAGLEPLLDDRDERLGFKLKDSDLLGIPYKIILGKSFLENGRIEIESRRGEKLLLAKDEVLAWARSVIL